MKNGPGKVEETCLLHSFYSSVFFLTGALKRATVVETNHNTPPKRKNEKFAFITI